MYIACKNQVGNRQKIKLKNQLCEIEILKNQVQIDKGKVLDTLPNMTGPTNKSSLLFLS